MLFKNKLLIKAEKLVARLLHPERIVSKLRILADFDPKQLVQKHLDPKKLPHIHLDPKKLLPKKLVPKSEEEFLQKLSKIMPITTQVYRVFKAGYKIFMDDFKEYIQVVRFLNTAGQGGKFESLSRHQIEVYFQMPKDLYQLIPVMIISMLPIVSHVSFHIACLFPKKMLSPQFWNPQQKIEFTADKLKARILYNEPLFRCFLDDLDSLQRHRLYQKWGEVLGMMGSGFHPRVEQIMGCKEMFMCPPYHLLYLKERHLKYLLKIHDLHTGAFRIMRLYEKAKILKEMDKAIEREGGVYFLTTEMLRYSCFVRGLSSDNLKKAEMIRWLIKWITISSVVDRDSLSLLLHCPILLGYTEGTNWHLVYNKKRKKVEKEVKKL